jgi:hypothetical protein
VAAECTVASNCAVTVGQHVCGYTSTIDTDSDIFHTCAHRYGKKDSYYKGEEKKDSYYKGEEKKDSYYKPEYKSEDKYYKAEDKYGKYDDK